MAGAENIETRLFINNEFVEGNSRKTFPVVNPTTEEVITHVYEADAADIDRAVDCAQAAQPAWAELNSATRAAALNALARLILQNTERFTELDSMSMGAPVSMYSFQVKIAADWLTYYGGLGMDIHGETSLRSANHLNLVLKQPFGVGAIIIPWNGPLLVAAPQVGAAVAAGNAVILKSSEKAPLSCILLARLIADCGLFPPGIVQIVSGMGATTGALLASHMRIRKLSFIGSGLTGRKVKQMAAASNLKNVTCELGGKSPLLVFEDADLALAASDAAKSIGFNSGQTCVASSRIYVHNSIRTEFIAAFKMAFSQLMAKPGDPQDPSTTQGPQVDVLQFRSIMRYLDGAREDGLVPEMGGGRLGSKGFFIQPTLFVDPPKDHPINTREIFGPIVMLHGFADEAEALALANDTEYGLYSSVYTRDISRALRLAKQLEAGTVAINCASPTVFPDMSFGGWKQSGEGRQWGRAGIEGWLESKSVFINLIG